MIKSLEINTIAKATKEFSICTLVTNKQEYDEMIESFYKAGFSDKNSEFLYIDNSKNNKYDAYDGINLFLNNANGRYIILCHQDILLQFDDIVQLRKKIDEVNHIDPKWAILANAGFQDFNNIALRMTDPLGTNRKIGHFPSKVLSIDENFIVVKREANLTLSSNVGGFHFYGTDLTFIADILGYNSYVIDFHLFHKSGGNVNKNFYDNKKRFIEKYTKTLQWKIVRTPVTPLFISNFLLLNKLCNTKLCYSFKKRWDRLIEFIR